MSLSLLLVAGCGGGSDGDGETSAGGAQEQAGQPEPEKPQPAAIEAALKSRLEASVAQMTVTSAQCTPRGEDFTCRVRAVSAGQPRSGRLKLVAQRGGRAFLGSGRLAGPGGRIKLSGLVVDLDQPAPARPPAQPGRSPLEQAIEASLQQNNPQLIITRLRCPEPEPSGSGAQFDCRAKGPYGVSPAVVVIHVTQRDEAGKRFVLRGTIDFTDPTGRKAHGTFEGVKVVVP